MAPFKSLAKITQKNPKNLVKSRGSTWQYLIRSKNSPLKTLKHSLPLGVPHGTN
jgi:hypothetical protein